MATIPFRMHSTGMKSVLFLLGFFMVGQVNAQNFEDGFSDGDFSNNPTWSGNVESFTIYNLDGNNVLRLNGSAGGVSYLSTPSTNVEGYWEFFVRIDGTAPSGSNKAEVILMSDQADLSGSFNGYGVRVGQTGDDIFHLVRYDAGTEAAVIISDTTVFQAGGSYRLKVTRDTSGKWTLEVGEGYNGELKNAGISGTDNTYTTAAFFGVRVSYTSSRTDDYYFDFKIDARVEPFYVETATVFDPVHMDVQFNRDVDVSSVAPSDFLLNGSITPQSFSNVDTHVLRLLFSNPLPGGQNQLAVSGIEPATNDTILADTTIWFYVFDEYEAGDILINEFLKDPPGGSGLVEYVELVNRTNKYINLKNWNIGDNSSLATISEEEFVFLPDTFLVLTSNPDALQAVYGSVYTHKVSLPALNNEADQIRLISSNGFTVDSLEYNYAWGGVDVALERRSLDFPTTLRANWGDSPNEQYGTPGRQNQIEKDTTPPEVTRYDVLNDSLIELIFSEEIKSEPATKVSNYLLIGASDNDLLPPEIQMVAFFPSDTVHLYLDRALEGDSDGEHYSLTILNQEDVFGNVAPEQEIRFEKIKIEEAAPGEVVINEFMYDPAEGYSEFVELYNPTIKNFDLLNWSIADNTGNKKKITHSSFVLAPGEYVVLAPDSTIYETFGASTLLQVSGFPALNNTTDAIALYNAEGQLIDSLTYFSTWGGEEVSLERRRPDVSAFYKANWGESPATTLGTPGRANEIEQDVSPPVVVSASFISAQEIRLIFDETPVGEEVLDPKNYLINGMEANLTPTAIGDTVMLEFDTPFTDGQELEILIRNLADIFGNVQTGQNINLKYIQVGAVSPLEVVINEILYHRKDQLSPEFVELYNRSDKHFDLSGWTLTDAGNNSATIPDGTFLKAGEYLVLTDQMDFAQYLQPEQSVYLSDFPGLNDSVEELILKNEKRVTIDSVYYDALWGGNDPGISLERKDPSGPSNDPSNWASNTAKEGHSAGRPSTVYEEDVVPPTIIFSTKIDTAVLVVFSEFVDVTPQTEFLINGSASQLIGFHQQKKNELLITGNEVVYSGKVRNKQQEGFNVVVRNIADWKGNTVAEISIPVAAPVEQFPLVINEIMYDPLADAEDNLPDQTEYIEIYNPHSHAVSLEGVILHDAPDELNAVRVIIPVTTQYKWIAPQGYALIYAEDEAEHFSESRLARYFGLENESDQFTLRVDRSSLSLGASGDAVYLADSTGATIDSVFYDESWHNPNIYDTDGIALELINPELSNDDGSNWSSSTSVSGGSPLSQNTIYQLSGAAPAGVGISLEPNPFSPDGDGFEDNLFIKYSLDAPDYLLRVRIFDRYGRQVRELVEGYPAGFEGTLIWDGLTDDRRKNRVGIYIVFFEAYNSTTGHNHTFKKTVVLARKF